MHVTISPGPLRGAVAAIPSKSCAHRILLCAALADAPTFVSCGPVGQDVQATVCCLQALGAQIVPVKNGYQVTPITVPPASALLPCGESGSTLRFLLPVVGALGVEATFQLSGRLPSRPLSPLWEQMEDNGCQLHREGNLVFCQGRLRPGVYTVAGDVSSQFVSGLLMALPMLGNSSIQCTSPLESRPYVDMTLNIMEKFGIVWKDFSIPEKQAFHSPSQICVEGDWSNAAFFLGANALGSQITLSGLCHSSCQGDRAVPELLCRLEYFCTLSAADIPDLIPILAVVASVREGAVFTDIRRLRLKESDRVAAIVDMLTCLGGKAEATENTLRVFPAPLLGGTVDPHNDHRIAMAAAIAATVCQNPVTILNAQCTDKSYPRFWEDYVNLGGKL